MILFTNLSVFHNLYRNFIHYYILIPFLKRDWYLTSPTLFEKGHAKPFRKCSLCKELGEYKYILHLKYGYLSQICAGHDRRTCKEKKKKRILVRDLRGFPTNSRVGQSSSAKRNTNGRKSAQKDKTPPEEVGQADMTRSSSLNIRRDFVRHRLNLSPQNPSESASVIALESVPEEANVETAEMQQTNSQKINDEIKNVVNEPTHHYPQCERLVAVVDHDDERECCSWSLCLDKIFCF